MEHLGTRLHRFRIRNGWSKRAIAKRLGVSIPSIMRWEDGTSEPNDYNRHKIEQMLKMHANALDQSLSQMDLFAQPKPPARRRT
jgi:transcriptional regulator with XRE-family HTH domain